MTMNKFFTGLIALVAGVALSAGSAFATKGVMAGDPAMMKLVPYYETGDTKATIIGVQNLSPQEATTAALHMAVMAAQGLLDGDDGADRNKTARLEGNLADAMDAIYTEHVFVSVGVFDDMGMMMESATLCLAEHQFGYVVLQGPSSEMMDYNQAAVRSYMDGDISAYGYVQIMAEDRKFTGCGAAAPNSLMNVDTDADVAEVQVNGADSQLGVWTIIQDVGDGFFGTEVPTSTISMAAARSVGANADGVSAPDDFTFDTDDDGIENLAEGAMETMLDAELACYSDTRAADGTVDVTLTRPARVTPDNAPAGVTPGQLPNSEGEFDQSRCGLIPERHFMLIDAMGNLDTTGEDRETDGTRSETDLDNEPDMDSSTFNGHAFARYDAGDESMIVVWLAKGMDDPDGRPSHRRMIDAEVRCEDGTVVKNMDIDGNPIDIKIPAPTMVTMIDPNGDTLSEFTDMCAGDRGVVRMTMPTNSHAGAVFSHITQMGGHYRMNFSGYNMASPDEIDAAPAATQ